MRKNKYLFLIPLFLVLFFAIDRIILEFSAKNNIELKLKTGGGITGKFSESLIAYQNDYITIFKWEVASEEKLNNLK